MISDNIFNWLAQTLGNDPRFDTGSGWTGAFRNIISCANKLCYLYARSRHALFERLVGSPCLTCTFQNKRLFGKGLCNQHLMYGANAFDASTNIEMFSELLCKIQRTCHKPITLSGRGKEGAS